EAIRMVESLLEKIANSPARERASSLP
ncbi:MAG: hypothetical protein JWO42_4064, partial [Chloroflexi bacterium]|nr:hypothetical protein [Chloroflexota bacterium]